MFNSNQLNNFNNNYINNNNNKLYNNISSLISKKNITMEKDNVPFLSSNYSFIPNNYDNYYYNYLNVPPNLSDMIINNKNNIYPLNGYLNYNINPIIDYAYEPMENMTTLQEYDTVQRIPSRNNNLLLNIYPTEEIINNSSNLIDQFPLSSGVKNEMKPESKNNPPLTKKVEKPKEKSITKLEKNKKSEVKGSNKKLDSNNKKKFKVRNKRKEKSKKDKNNLLKKTNHSNLINDEENVTMIIFYILFNIYDYFFIY